MEKQIRTIKRKITIDLVRANLVEPFNAILPASIISALPELNLDHSLVLVYSPEPYFRLQGVFLLLHNMSLRFDYRNNLIHVVSVPLNYMSSRLTELTFHGLGTIYFSQIESGGIVPLPPEDIQRFSISFPQRVQVVVFCQPHIADRTRNGGFTDGRHGVIKVADCKMAVSTCCFMTARVC